MNASLFTLSLLLAIVGPLVAIGYLRPILGVVLRSLCDAAGGAEFWIRSAYLLAICGTLLLTLVFGRFGVDVTPIESLQRSLLLVALGVFGTIAFIARNVWSQVRYGRGPSAPVAREAAERAE